MVNKNKLVGILNNGGRPDLITYQQLVAELTKLRDEVVAYLDSEFIENKNIKDGAISSNKTDFVNKVDDHLEIPNQQVKSEQVEVFHEGQKTNLQEYLTEFAQRITEAITTLNNTDDEIYNQIGNIDKENEEKFLAIYNDIDFLKGTITGTLKREIVEILPEENIDLNTIYMLKSSEPLESNIYNEYMYINNEWEQIGSTAVDLDKYYTKEEIDNKITPIVNQLTEKEREFYGIFTLDSNNKDKQGILYKTYSSGVMVGINDGTDDNNSLYNGANFGFVRIPKYVYVGNALKKVLYISRGAFLRSYTLKSIEFMGDITISPNAFAGCSNLSKVIFNRESEVVLESGGSDSQFSGTILKEIYFPNSVNKLVYSMLPKNIKVVLDNRKDKVTIDYGSMGAEYYNWTVEYLRSDCTKEDIDMAIRDAMYDIPTVSFTEDNGKLADGYVNGISIHIRSGEVAIGGPWGGTASAGWGSEELIIPAYVRDQYGEVHKVTTIDQLALVNNKISSESQYSYTEVSVYIPKTITKFESACFEQYYGEAGGHLNIIVDGVTPGGYDPATTTVYDISNPLLITDYYTKKDINSMISGQVKREIVSTLPKEGVDGTIYMLNVGRFEELSSDVFSANWDGHSYRIFWEYTPGNYYTDIMQLPGCELQDSDGNYYSLGLDFNKPTKEDKYLITFSPELNKSVNLDGYWFLEEGIDIKIYAETPQGNIYEEYMWINGSYELIGSTEVNLTNYYTKSEIDTKLGNIESALDSIITIQNELLGGGTV